MNLITMGPNLKKNFIQNSKLSLPEVLFKEIEIKNDKVNEIVLHKVYVIIERQVNTKIH